MFGSPHSGVLLILSSTTVVHQVVNELYGSTIHLCYKKAGASLAVIQQMAEKTAEKTAKQVSHAIDPPASRQYEYYKTWHPDRIPKKACPT